MAVLQILSGCVAPMLYHFCHQAKHAVRFAEQHGIDGRDGRLPRARVVQHRLCSVAYLPSRMLVLLPLVAGILVMLSQAVY